MATTANQQEAPKQQPYTDQQVEKATDELAEMLAHNEALSPKEEPIAWAPLSVGFGAGVALTIIAYSAYSYNSSSDEELV